MPLFALRRPLAGWWADVACLITSRRFLRLSCPSHGVRDTRGAALAAQEVQPILQFLTPRLVIGPRLACAVVAHQLIEDLLTGGGHAVVLMLRVFA
jgi:hypothetical protein